MNLDELARVGIGVLGHRKTLTIEHLCCIMGYIWAIISYGLTMPGNIMCRPRPNGIKGVTLLPTFN